MPGNTTPDNIVYPLSTDPIAPLNVVFQDMADSVQAALLPKVITSPTAGQKLVYDGTDWVNITGYMLVQTLTYIANGNFQKANYPWLRAIRVICAGAGGGGGGAILTGATQMSLGQGGGGGVYAESFITDLSTVAAIETVTVGAGGGGGVGNATGTAGGTTSFGSLVSANGGVGGTSSGAAAAGPLAIIVDAPATTGSGQRIVPGHISSGSVGVTNAAATGVRGGNGGSGFNDAPGGRGSNGGANGGNAETTAYGAGGGGAANSQNNAASRTGGSGAGGIVIVELYA